LCECYQHDTARKQLACSRRWVPFWLITLMMEPVTAAETLEMYSYLTQLLLRENSTVFIFRENFKYYINKKTACKLH
jgi:hypothetical protein